MTEQLSGSDDWLYQEIALSMRSVKQKTMKKLAFAVALQIAILTISVAAQTPNIPRTASAFAVRSNSAPSAVAGSNSATSAVANAGLAKVYRVGISDVLDIQLPDTPNTKSTLFTVLPGGLIEYPLAGEPLRVAGLTTTEIANQLRQKIKVLDRPTVNVTVRDYASHTVTIVGFVSAPGTKILRREVVPLYVLLAEAQPLAEATTATIKRGQAEMIVDLKDNAATATLIAPGDTIKIYDRIQVSTIR
jgi:hypothetical protein